MRELLRWAVVAVAVLHGLIHFLGAAKGLGWAEVPQLKQPIGAAMGALWLTAGLAVLATGVLLTVGWRGWWVVGAVAVLASQAAILTSWSDAKAGTAANLVLLLAVLYGFATQGPGSFRAEGRFDFVEFNAETLTYDLGNASRSEDSPLASSGGSGRELTP